MRSQLFVPGDSEKKLGKCRESDADCLFIDLEDSVAAPNKDRARAMSREFLVSLAQEKQRPLLYVRVNALDTGLTDRDLDFVMPGRPDGILLPKSQGGTDVQHLAAKLSRREAENGIVDSATRICCVATETASALFGLSSYAGASRRLSALTWGAEDLSADVGAETNRREDGEYTQPYQLVRSMLLFTAVAAGVQPLDAVYPSYKDEEGLRRECIASRRDGFTGKMAIHPAQVPVINEIFTPPDAEVKRARRIVEAFANDPSAGVIGLEGEMLDKPHLERARKILARVGTTPPT